MQINLEAADPNAIQSYNDSQVRIDGVNYQHNLIVSKDGIVTDWPIESIKELHSKPLDALITSFASKPKIILIGQPTLGALPPVSTLALLANQGIGLECMSIGAACRTYNVLLSESREVILGIIFGR